jgi:hypothetical protein
MARSSPFCLLAAHWPCLVFSQTYEAAGNSASLRSRKWARRSDGKLSSLMRASFAPTRQLLASICLSIEVTYSNFQRQKGKRDTKRHCQPPSPSCDCCADSVRSTLLLPLCMPGMLLFCSRPGEQRRRPRTKRCCTPVEELNPTTEREGFSASRQVFSALDNLVRVCGCLAYHVGDFRGERAPWESKITGSKRRHRAFSTFAGGSPG